MEWRIHPVSRIQGAVSVPGDKSISHRLALMSALASGQSVLHMLLDCRLHLHIVNADGVENYRLLFGYFIAMSMAFSMQR